MVVCACLRIMYVCGSKELLIDNFFSKIEMAGYLCILLPLTQVLKSLNLYWELFPTQVGRAMNELLLHFYNENSKKIFRKTQHVSA